MSGRFVVLALTAGLLAGACGPTGEDQETGTITRDDVIEARSDLEPAVLAALDSGNTAYRGRRYEDARARYREAIRLDDDVAAAWFGLYMAELALGNAEEAQAAMDRARSLAPGASLIHPATDTVP